MSRHLVHLAALLLAAAASGCGTPPSASDDSPGASPPRLPGEAAPPPAAPAAPAQPAAAARDDRLFLGAAARHACLLGDGGALRCWGRGEHGQLGDGVRTSPQAAPAAVPDLPPVTRAALGARHTCVLLETGAVRCFGSNDAGQLGAEGARGRADVEGLGQVVDLVAGEAFTCALDAAQEISCWGKLPGGDVIAHAPRRIPDVRAARIAAASRSVCALRTTGALACWGDNRERAIHMDEAPHIGAPTDVQKLDELGKIAGVALSDDATCVLLEDGRAACWGARHFWSFRPDVISGVEKASSITGGGAGHFCIRNELDMVHCWGAKRTGAAGDGWGTSYLHGDAVEVRAGLDFACARTRAGEVACWGDNEMAQLAQDGGETIPRPTRLSGGVRTFAAAERAVCAVLADGAVRCWGPAPEYENPEDPGPSDYPAITRADDFTMGGTIFCALTGRLPTCWGHNRAGQLPSQNLVEIPPSTLASLGGLKALAFGPEHACSLAEDGAVTCWGGLGKTRATPAPIRGAAGAATIALGAAEGCALLDDGGVACWALGDPGLEVEKTPRFMAARVAGVRGATALAHGKDGACVAEARGGVRCWGPGRAPEAIAGIEGAVEIALGDEHGCARQKDGTVACWGKNDQGQLGDGTYEDRAAARVVPGIEGVVRVGAGSAHTCALDGEGDVYCWGSNRAGTIQKGPPLRSKKPLPVRVAAAR